MLCISASLGPIVLSTKSILEYIFSEDGTMPPKLDVHLCQPSVATLFIVLKMTPKYQSFSSKYLLLLS
jgi:hypothetical protein